MSEDCLCQHSQELIPLSLFDLALSLCRILIKPIYLSAVRESDGPGVTHCTFTQCWPDHTTATLHCLSHQHLLDFHVSHRDCITVLKL